MKYEINPQGTIWSIYKAKDQKTGEEFEFMVQDFDKEFILIKGDKNKSNEIEKAFWDTVEGETEENGMNYFFPHYSNVISRNTMESPFWEQENPDWE